MEFQGKWYGKDAIFPKEVAEAVRILNMNSSHCTRPELVEKLNETYPCLDDLIHQRLSFAIIQAEREGFIATYDKQDRRRRELPYFGKRKIPIAHIKFCKDPNFSVIV